MNESFKSHSETPQQEPDTLSLLKKMQQQLVFLEKKVDQLLAQSSERSFKGGPRPFSKPFRHGGNHHRERNFSQGQGQGNRSFDQQPQHNENRGGFGGPPRHKKPFFKRRKDRD